MLITLFSSFFKSNDKPESSGEVKCISKAYNFLEAVSLGLTKEAAAELNDKLP